MSYEQKYLKYKQKYIDLKNKLRETMGSEQVDTIMLTDTPNNGAPTQTVEQTGAGILDTITMLLSDTPTQENSTGNEVVEQVAEQVAEQEVEQTEQELALTETPVLEQTGGWNVSDAAPVANLGSGVPNTVNCPGNVNVQPSTVVPVMDQGSDVVVPPAVEAPAVEAPVVEAPTVEAPTVEAPVASDATQRKNLVERDEATTTDLSEIRNTADIEKIFSQLGGHEKDVLDSTSSSSIFSSDSLSESDSDLTVSM